MSGGAQGGGGPLVTWASLQLTLGAGLAIWSHSIPALLFLNGALIVLAFAAFNRLRPPGGEPRLLARVSVPVLVLATGTALAAVGVAAGLWLVLIGGELALLGAAWLTWEILGEHRAVADD